MVESEDSGVENDNNFNKAVSDVIEHDEEDLEVFQPTADWQAIKPGQGIPPGLHVRMNLQSGVKEAKLMDGDDGKRYQSNGNTKQKFIKIDKNIISKQHLKEALKDFRDKFHDESPTADSSEELGSRLEESECENNSVVITYCCLIQYIEVIFSIVEIRFSIRSKVPILG